MRTPLDCCDYMGKSTHSMYKNHDWLVVRDYQEFCEVITTIGLPVIVSFDHDLCEEHYREGMRTEFQEFDYNNVTTHTGYHCLGFLLDYCDKRGTKIPNIFFHTMNSAGMKNMKQLKDQFLANHKVLSSTINPVGLRTPVIIKL